MANEVEDLKKELGTIPKILRAEMRGGLRDAGKVVANDAKLRAGWSRRIPRAIRVSVKFTGRQPGVSVVVNRNKAPHARPYEHGGEDGTFSHPRWGDRRAMRDPRFEQRARPFLAPALTAKGDEAAKQLADVVERAVRKAVH